MDIRVEELRGYFLSKTIGRRIEFHEESASTNTEALRLALDGTPEGTDVMADAQSEGRGRLDRVWESPPSRNLYFSVVLRPDIAAASASLVPVMVVRSLGKPPKKLIRPRYAARCREASWAAWAGAATMIASAPRPPVSAAMTWA